MGTGLRLTLIGAQVIGWSLAAAFALVCGGAGVLSGFELGPLAGWLFGGLFFTTLSTVVLGRVLCAVGRWVCLATPPEATTARARVRLVVVLETCGLLSGLTTIGLAFSGLPIPPELGLTGMGFCVVTTVSARVMFFHFARAVADCIAVDSTAQDALRLFRVSLVAVGAVVVGSLLLALGNSLSVGDVDRIPLRALSCVAVGLLLAVAFFLGLYLLAGHFMLTADLRRHLSRYTPPPADDDPDRDYRERYSATHDPTD